MLILLCVSRSAESESVGVSFDMDGTTRMNSSSLFNRTIRLEDNLVYDVDRSDGRMARCGGASESSVNVTFIGVTAKAHPATRGDLDFDADTDSRRRRDLRSEESLSCSLSGDRFGVRFPYHDWNPLLIS